MRRTGWAWFSLLRCFHERVDEDHLRYISTHVVWRRPPLSRRDGRCGVVLYGLGLFEDMESTHHLTSVKAHAAERASSITKLSHLQCSSRLVCQCWSASLGGGWRPPFTIRFSYRYMKRLVPQVPSPYSTLHRRQAISIQFCPSLPRESPPPALSSHLPTFQLSSSHPHRRQRLTILFWRHQYSAAQPITPFACRSLTV